MSRPNTSAKRLAVIAAATGAVVLGGLAAAGALPGAAQQVAADALDNVGITVPSPNEASNGHADVRGKSVLHTPDSSAPTTAATTASTTAATTAPTSTPPDTAGNGQGSEISQIARTTDATGVDKGAEISNQASNGQSHAGEEHPSGGAPPSVPASTPDHAANGLSHHP